MVKKQADIVDELRQKNSELLSRLSEAEEALNAIRNGEVDAIVVSGTEGEKIFSLTSAETPYRIILEEMAEGAVIIKADGTILYCNNRFSKIFSDSEQIIAGSNLLSLISGKERSSFKKIIKEGLSGKTSGIISHTNSLFNNHVYLNLSLSPLPSEIAGDICVIVSDVTKMHEYQNHLQELVIERTDEIEKANKRLRTDLIEIAKAKEALKESDDLLGSILENSQDCIYRYNIQTCSYEYISPAVKDLVGYSPKEIIALDIQTTLLMIHPDFISALNEAQALSEKTGKAMVEYRQKSKNGDYRWISNHMSVINDAAGRPLYRVGSLRNVTEQIEAQNGLRAAQSKLRIALENGNIGIWEWDLTTGEIIWDERLEKMFNLQPGEFGRTVEAFESLINEEDITHVQKALQSALEKDLPYETIYRTKPTVGKAKYISSKALLNKDRYGKPISFTGVCFDVTSLREGTEKLVIKLNEDLLLSNKELESFAYVASHDLQEPLRMVTSFTQLLERQYKDKLDDKALEYIHFAVDGANRMYELINGLLAFSRVHTKGKTFTQVDLNKTVDTVRKNLGLSLKESNALLDVSELPIVFADESQMILLFQNFIGNSIKFSNDSPKIFISSSSDSVYNTISIKDEGLGIEPQYFDRIFQIFQRLHTRDKYEGTGIGLAICKRIVERHGGKIWVDSVFEKGSTFYFTLPKKIT